MGWPRLREGAGPFHDQHRRTTHSMPITPQIPLDVQRARWSEQIARDPTPATWRGRAVTVRVGQPSARRQTMLAGVRDSVDALEVWLLAEPGEPMPVPMSSADMLRFSLAPNEPELRWRLVEAVESYRGSGCWVLTVDAAR